MGQRDHSKLQDELTRYLGIKAKEWGVHVFTGRRIKVSADRFRRPDICVVAGSEPDAKVVREPPFICIEIISKSTKMRGVQKFVDDYVAIGVPYTWVVIPNDLLAWIYTSDGCRVVRDGVLRTEHPAIELSLPEMFAGLDGES